MQFTFIAKDKAGKVEQGTMEAVDKAEVAEKLKSKSLWPTMIEEKTGQKKKKASSIVGSIFTVPLKNKMIFCRHLAVMIASGLPVSRSLSILAKQERNGTLRVIIEKMVTDVRKGVSFADAMARHPKTFDAVFVSMVRMGEVSGNLEEVLRILADQLEKDHKLITKVRGAMIYPAVIMTVMIVIGFLMMIFVVPKITATFKDYGAELPFLTQVVITVSDFMADNALLTLGGLIGLGIGTKVLYSTELGKRIFHKIFLKLPIIGGIVIKVNSARFSRILSSLLDSGTSLVDSLKITADTLGNYYFKRAVLTSSNQIQKGLELSTILDKEKGTFPYLVTQMIQVGEETGKTPEILKKLAGFYEEEVDQITKNLSSIIEPILIVVIGAAVGVFAVAVIQPIYSIMERI